MTITVEPGDYALTETLLIDRSLELRGSTEQVDGTDSWPTGEVVPGTLTRVFAANRALTQLVLVDRGDGTVLRDVAIRGFVFEGVATGISLLLNRVQGYWIADNVFRAPATFAMQFVASSGEVSGNHFSGVGTGAIFTGGYAESPSSVVFQGNRAVHNTLGGVLLNGASINIPELGDKVTAVVRDNDLSEKGGDSGIRIPCFHPTARPRCTGRLAVRGHRRRGDPRQPDRGQPVAADDVRLIQAFTNIGLVPDTGGTYLLPRLVASRVPPSCCSRAAQSMRRRRGSLAW